MRPKVGIALRRPQFPVVAKTEKSLWGFKSLQTLVGFLSVYNPRNDGTGLLIVDARGEEFFFDRERSFIVPEFLVKKWTKKRLIQLYNSRCKREDFLYTRKNLNSIKLAVLVEEICVLILKNF